MIRIPETYELISKRDLVDINSKGYLLKHKKSGARVFLVSNDDENKVFHIGFRTPVDDSTGVPHIIEHSVLCGSERYPLKDPFIELAKGSLNTFLNAMTYPDRTVYPVASCNHADFANLMGVYLDAVFYPRIYQYPEIFMQEGWHYELNDVDDELTINGVVYNEMKGVFSSPDQIHARLTQKVLFPDTTYSMESGGDPKDIPDLSYEEFLDFHRRYYHPSNSYIYLYGDVDMEERLEYMDKEYLSRFDAIEIDSEIKLQEAFDEMRCVAEPYSVQDEGQKAQLSYNCVVDTSLNSMFSVAFQAIAYALVQVPGAPIKQALMDAGVGEEIECSFDSELFQPVFSIDANETDREKMDEFVFIVKNELKKACKEGINKDSLRAFLSGFEFRYKESDFGRYPKGLMLGLGIMQTWLYDDDNPYEVICQNDLIDKLKELVDTDYYEKLVEEYLLNNTHSAVICIYPEVGLGARANEELRKKLAEYKASLSEDEVMDIVNNTAHLKAFQEEGDSEEALLSVPILTIDDIEKKVSSSSFDLKKHGSTDVVYVDVKTNEIAYITLAYDFKKYVRYVQYLNLLTSILTYVDTKDRNFYELSNDINLKTGGMTFNLNLSNMASGDDYVAKMEVNFAVLFDRIQDGFDIVSDVLKNSIITDKKRLLEIIQEIRADLRSSMEASGNSTAAERIFSYLSELGYYQGLASSVGYYRFIDYVYKNFDDVSDKLIDILSSLIKAVFRKDNLIANVTCGEEGYEYFGRSFDQYLDEHPEAEDVNVIEPIFVNPKMGVYNEAFKTPGKVQYVARGGRFLSEDTPFTGSLYVLKTILSYDYLWLRVRLQGGAYGAMGGFYKAGFCYFASYRDPNLRETNDVFEEIADYVEAFDCDDREMTKYIIGTLSSVDAPLTPRGKGRSTFNRYLAGITKEERQKTRDELLSTTVEKIRGLAGHIRNAMSDQCICVIGGAEKIEENKDLFKNIEDLL